MSHGSLRRAGPKAWLVLMLWLIACAPTAGLCADSSLPQTTLVLDRFDDLDAWKASASEGVAASIHPAEGVDGRALRLDFDLAGTAGYALAARSLPLELPSNYELTLWIRGDAPTNDLQIKLVDASGDNVWWFHQKNFELSHEWRLLRIRKRQIEFAWGPSEDHELHRAARLELVVAAGRAGGSGSIYFCDLNLRVLPAAPATWPAPLAQASSNLPNADAALALDGNVGTAWRSDPSTGAAQTLTIDLGQPREFGGLIVRWEDRAYASRYDVQFSDDGERWRTVRSVSDGRGGPDALALADAETRFVRLALYEGPTPGYAIAEVEIEEPVFAASPNAFFEALARASPRGFFPRGFSGEQPYWTLVGVDGGADSGLLSEDGALEVASGGFSIEPYIVESSKVTTWADVAPTQALAAGYLPLPQVVWQQPGWRLEVAAFGSGTRENSRLVAAYELRNLGVQPISLRLVLAVRPFQVNPPAQFLNVEGGVSKIRDIAWDGTALTVNGTRKVYPLQSPDRIGMATFDAGPVPQWAAAEHWAGPSDVHDPSGYASAALGYDVVLAPGAATTVGLVVPLTGSAAAPARGAESAQAWIAREQRGVAAAWRAKLDHVTFDVPPEAHPLIDTMRTALAHLFITRDGAMLRPGTRAYARSWIRDGAMMAEALLQLAHPDAAADYLRWFAPYQFADGKVPCCVDARGADPVAENDSDGEFVFLVDEVLRYAHDPALRASMWPRVVAAMHHLDALRQSGRDGADLVAERRAFYGLLPASISHEGYASKPMHSYWDDFWAMRGYDAAIDLANGQGAAAEALRWGAARDEFQRDLQASLRTAMAAHDIAYVPGAAELGDFDPTSTAIAFAPGFAVLSPTLPSVRATYERYWQSFVARRDGREVWNEYTPYELRIVGTFVRLGWRDRAQELLAYFLQGRRPQAWNQWAEVVGRGYRQPRFIGDMPHGWIASDFIRAVVDLFAYERDADRALVLGRGIPSAWLDGHGVAVRDLRTPYGNLTYSLRKDHRRTILRVDAASGLPPGGFVLIAPDGKQPKPAKINGRPVPWQAGELRIAELPATVVVNEPW